MLQSTYIIVDKFSCICKLCSITQKRVRSSFSRWFTRLHNSWTSIKIDANYEIMIIDYWNFGLSMNALTDHVANSGIRKMIVKKFKHQRVCVAIIKFKIYTKYEQGKFGCCGSTVVLGKWLSHGVRHICYRSKMVLGNWLLCEHIGVRHMAWKKHLGKNLDIWKDRTLFDVPEEKTFN